MAHKIDWIFFSRQIFQIVYYGVYTAYDVYYIDG